MLSLRKYNTKEFDNFCIEEFNLDLNFSSKVVESVLLDIPLGNIICHNKVVLDGCKRVEALRSFINGEFRLNSLDVLGRYNGCLFSDIPLRKKLITFQFSVCVIDVNVESEVIDSILNRMKGA